MNIKIIVTGGHLGPALGVIEKLPKNSKILFVGRKHTFEGDTSLSFEYQMVQSLKIPFREITTGRLQRTFTKYTIGSLLKFPIGFLQSLIIIKKFKPDVILSFGGYISLPVVLAGKILRVPVVIHEQTFSPGVANRITSFFATKICISWSSTKKYFPISKTILTGNPIRKLNTNKLSFGISNEKIPLLYITGGSAGSHTINLVIMQVLEELLANLRVIHQTGDSWDFHDFDKLNEIRENILPQKLKKRYVITKFINASRVGAIYKSADLVVSRGGVNTITELIYFGKTALLIPLNIEQTKNALFMKKIGLGEILHEEDLNSAAFLQKVKSMIKNRDRYSKKNMKDLNLTKDAAQEIVEVITSEVRKKRTKK